MLEIIREDSPGKWSVYSEKGRRLGGPYDSRAKAEERLRQVEYFKRKGGKRQ